MRLFCASAPVLAIGALFSCASHNSHRVAIDIGRDLAPLVEQAVQEMDRNARGDLPLSKRPVQVHVDVEPVRVDWFSKGADGEPARPLQVADLVEQARRSVDEILGLQAAGASAKGPDLLVVVTLLIDLREFDELRMRVTSKLSFATTPESFYAFGESELATFPRGYCHGCRESPFYNLGSSLGPEDSLSFGPTSTR